MRDRQSYRQPNPPSRSGYGSRQSRTLNNRQATCHRDTLGAAVSRWCW